MIQRLISLLFLVLLGGCVSAQAAPQAAPQESSRTIIAIGDLHGDYDAYESLMREAGLLDRRGRWSGGDTIFIQTGDVPDRGPDSLKIIRSLIKLKEQAARDGGEVITIVGNHEAMNVTRDLRYVHPGEYKAFADSRSNRLRDRVYDDHREEIEASYRASNPMLSDSEIRKRWYEATPYGKLEHQLAWSPGGELGDYAIGNPAVVIVGDGLFVHGGISDAYVKFSVDEMNAATSEALQEQSLDASSIINDPKGPLWYRGLVQHATDLNPLTGEGEVKRVLAAFGVKHIIVGHTPSLTGINALYDGAVIQIDTGISAYYGGTRSFLRIKDGVYYAHDEGNVRVISGGDSDAAD